jgi:WD40 repeat protein
MAHQSEDQRCFLGLNGASERGSTVFFGVEWLIRASINGVFLGLSESVGDDTANDDFDLVVVDVAAHDWVDVAGRIVSAGEDRKYKVWDAFGQCLYSSSTHDHPIMCCSWAPDGQLFAVGSYNMLRLCDVAGWSHSLDKPKCGAVCVHSSFLSRTCLIAATRFQ